MIVAEGTYTYSLWSLWWALQWGRNLIVAEGTVTCPLLEVCITLQWGRNLIVAEGRFQGYYAQLSQGFNGAAT